MEHRFEDLHISPDFQSDQTEGFPASLCWDTRQNVAFLIPNESMADDETELAYYTKLCEDFGDRSCADRDDFNSILKELGEDADHSAWLPEQDDSEEFGGLSL